MLKRITVIAFVLLVTFLIPALSENDMTETVRAVEEIELPQELSMNSHGNQVLDLQRRLYVLGFLNGATDGIYGNDTYKAVKEFEEYVRLLEQRDIDAAVISATPLPGSKMTTVPANPSAVTETVLLPNTAPAIPTATPTPKTVVDGIADLELQTVLYDPDNDLYLDDVFKGSEGMTARRVQRRLITLNYLNDIPDGVFGVNSETALKAFQERNGLTATGIADRETQRLLFSIDAKSGKKPVYNQLSLGSSGSVVSNVQKQLIILGFMNGSASGYYDAATRDGVISLEKYLFVLDHPELKPVTTPAPYVTAEEIADGASLIAESIAADEEENPYGIIPETESAADALGFAGTGIMDDALIRRFLEDGIPVYSDALRRGDTGDDVLRVQRRLRSLGYLTANGIDGIFGGGTEKAVIQFQSRNKMEQTGIADQTMQYTLFSDSAVKGIKPYQIKVSTSEQRVYVYQADKQDNYTVLAKTFICSTGLDSTPTPKGTFTNTGRGARWHYFTKFDCWAQYAWYIYDDIMFHSVLFSLQDVNTLRQGTVNALGRKASHGCVRLSVSDAKWIWDNCAAGTTVVVY